MSNEVIGAINELGAQLDRKHEENVERYEQLHDEIKRALSGFPQNDPEAHRRYHESVIEWRELRNKLVREALIKSFGAGAVAGTGWVIYALWQAFKTTIMVKS